MSGLAVASIVVLWIFVLVLAFLLVGTMRQVGMLQMRLGDDPGALITREGLDRGADAPDFVARWLGTDEEVAFREWATSDPSVTTLMVFLSTTCSACTALVPHVNEVAAAHRDDLRVMAVCRDQTSACGRFRDANRLAVPVCCDPDGAVERAYQVEALPFAYLIGSDGRVLFRGVANDWRHLEAVVNQVGVIQSAPWTVVSDA